MHWTGYLGMLLASLSLIFGIAAGGGTANHLGGLLAGFLSGYFCLRNMQANRQNQFERYAGLGFGAVFLLVFFVAVTYTPLDALGNYKLAMAMRRIDDGDAPAALPLIEEYLRRHPDYRKAADAELEAVRRGDHVQAGAAEQADTFEGRDSTHQRSPSRSAR